MKYKKGDLVKYLGIFGNLPDHLQDRGVVLELREPRKQVLVRWADPTKGHNMITWVPLADLHLVEPVGRSVRDIKKKDVLLLSEERAS